MPSLRSKAIATLIKFSDTKKRLNRLQRTLAKGGWKRIDAPPTPAQLKKYAITRQEVHGRTVWSFSRKHSTGQNPVLYLHGGIFFNGLAPAHWAMFAHLVDQIDCTLIIPDYPLAPEFTVQDAFPMVLAVYRGLSQQFDTSRLTLMGESAGGNLCLALAQHLREEQLPQPRQILLLSPWLDVSMSNPESTHIEALDPLLDIEGLRYAGSRFAGDLDTRHPRVSPLYGPLDGLAPVTLFIGTHDVLLPDCRELQRLAKAQGTTLDYHEYPAMLHIWMFMPIPEARSVIRHILAKLAMTTDLGGAPDTHYQRYPVANA